VVTAITFLRENGVAILPIWKTHEIITHLHAEQLEEGDVVFNISKGIPARERAAHYEALYSYSAWVIENPRGQDEAENDSIVAFWSNFGSSLLHCGFVQAGHTDR
jgi:hypothetical protein